MDTRNYFSTRIIATLFPALLAVAVLTGCQGQEPSKINAENNTAQTPAEQAEAIGGALGITAAKPALGTNGQVLLSLKTKPLHYSDAGLLVALEGEATLAESVQNRPNPLAANSRARGAVIKRRAVTGSGDNPLCDHHN